MVNLWNFAPRIKIPVLMLNGQDDSLFPVETSQKPLFQVLGTPQEQKQYIIYPGGHIDFSERPEVINRALAWLDQYVGPAGSR
jgi:pimeloyl-ACP methyl ester carboxylesterase